MKEKISIITTFYNCEKYILKCIQSVCYQNFNDSFYVEYILVDDHSTDNTREIIESFFKEYDFPKNFEYKIIKPLHNLGCGGARKFGINNATGDYFMFLDGDDYYLNNDFINRAYNIIKKYNADIVEFGFQRYNKQINKMTYRIADSFIILENDPYKKMYYLCNLHILNYMVWTKIVKRSIVESRPYDESRQYEDIKTTPYWIYNANRIIINPSIEINYRNTDESIINDNQLIYATNLVTAVSELFEFFKFDINILKTIYISVINEIRFVLLNYNSNNEYFNKMNEANTKMLNYIYEDKLKKN